MLMSDKCGTFSVYMSAHVGALLWPMAGVLRHIGPQPVVDQAFFVLCGEMLPSALRPLVGPFRNPHP